ncbi:hypothetical protein [Sorangium sp. So ce1335]|uniref:hypothetical protein n=1 Tax=Sorangium sp. So ce1335 TaxID=3133335 RepID=UPI003F5E134E
MTEEDIGYARVHHVIADDNYVFTLSEGTRNGAAHGFYGLRRVEGGENVEHWGSRRAVPASTMSGLGVFWRRHCKYRRPRGEGARSGTGATRRGSHASMRTGRESPRLGASSHLVRKRHCRRGYT